METRQQIIVTRGQLLRMFPNLTKNDFDNKHDVLINHLLDYMDIEVTDNGKKRLYKIIGELPAAADVPKCPRKGSALKEEKEKAYEEYVIKELTVTKPNTKIRVAQNAIEEFGEKRFNHTSDAAVARRYVGPAMEKYGERSAKKVWVHIHSYEPISEEQNKWLKNAFCQAFSFKTPDDMYEGWVKAMTDTGKAKEKSQNTFNKVVDNFTIKYGFRPICVYEWSLAEHFEE